MIRLKASSRRITGIIVFTLCLAAAVRLFPGQTLYFMERLTFYSVRSYLPVDAYVKAEQTEVTQEPSQAKIEEKTLKKTSAKTQNSLSDMDTDIAKLIKSAEKKASSDKKDGGIKEYTFTSDGVTDSFAGVRVRNTNETQINIEKKLEEKLVLTVNKKEPTVLIYHTHTTETYQLVDRDFYAQGFLSRSNDEAVNMVRVGKAVCEQLEKQGYKVIHDTSVYDNPYSGAYYRSEAVAREYLEKYPSIQITLDIHRDAIQDDKGVKTKPVAVVNDKKAAQIMLVTGCQEEGNGITDLPEWEKNLTFALKLQQSMESLFPGLTRPVFFCDRSYNMGLTPLSLLVEVGSDANTLDEAVYSGKMLGKALADILAEYEEK